MATHLEKVFTPNAHEHDPLLATQIANTIADFHMRETTEITPVSAQELRLHIQRLPKRKSPGPDLINNEILKHLSKKAVAYLTSICNGCMRLGYFPLHWRTANVLPIYKTGKDKHNPDSYRPISLLSTLAKLLEKVILTRLQDFILENEVIPPHQFGFRRSHSTAHQLIRITELIEKGFEEKKYTAAIFLDLERAFDKVWIEGLLYKMIKLNIPAYIIKIINSFLNNRTFRVRINATLSSIKTTKAGVPQGSLLGPTLFNLYVHDLPTVNNSTLAMFADDTAILTQGTTIETTIQRLQNAVNVTCDWYQKWKIKINPTKSQAKMFTLKRYTHLPTIRLNNDDIPWNPKDAAVKYLGVHLHAKLNWGYHLNKKINECHTRLILLYPLINRKSHLRSDCSLLIYKAILRPILTYACPVWSNAPKSSLKKLQTMQNKVLRLAINCPWFIRNSQIHQELSVPLISDYIHKLTSNFFKKLVMCPSATKLNLGQKNIHSRIKRKLPQDLL